MCTGTLGLCSCGHRIILTQAICYGNLQSRRCYFRWPVRRVDYQCGGCEIRDVQLANLQMRYQAKAIVLYRQCDENIEELRKQRNEYLQLLDEAWVKKEITMNVRLLKDDIIRTTYRQKEKNCVDLRDEVYNEYERAFERESKEIREYWEKEAEIPVLGEDFLNPKQLSIDAQERNPSRKDLLDYWGAKR